MHFTTAVWLLQPGVPERNPPDAAAHRIVTDATLRHSVVVGAVSGQLHHQLLPLKQRGDLSPRQVITVVSFGSSKLNAVCDSIGLVGCNAMFQLYLQGVCAPLFHEPEGSQWAMRSGRIGKHV